MMQTAKKSFKAIISAHVLMLYYEAVNNSLRVHVCNETRSFRLS